MLRRNFFAVLGTIPLTTFLFGKPKEEKEDWLELPCTEGQWTLCIIVKDGKRTFKWVECVEL